MPAVDINCDMGESTTLWPYSIVRDISLLEYVTSINIACASHAGDWDTAQRLIQEGTARNIAIGAHPSYPDPENFGREPMQIEAKELYRSIFEQLEFIAKCALVNGTRLHHVKLHGALYNMAAQDLELAYMVYSAIHAFDEDLIVYALSGSQMLIAAHGLGLKTCSEVFADRIYSENGGLVPRSETTGLIANNEQSVQQVLNMVKAGIVAPDKGNAMRVLAETVCIHSDGPNALLFAKSVHNALKQNGITISAP